MISKVLAIFLAYIAYQQWQTTERQRRQDLFEMRYELYKNIFENLEHNNLFISQLKNKPLKINHEEFHRKNKEFSEKLNKYGFLIKSNDFKELIQNYNKLGKNHNDYIYLKPEKITQETTKKFLDQDTLLKNNIHSILEPYLRIEPNYTIWEILEKWIKNTYNFLKFPKWLQNFLSKTKTVLLNLFQNLTKKSKNQQKK